MSISNDTHGPSAPVVTARSLAIFVAALAGFVLESELTQHVQTNLGYRQPFLIFYIVHSSFAIIFPIHLLYLVISSGRSWKSYADGLSLAIIQHAHGNRGIEDDISRLSFANRIYRAIRASLPTLTMLTIGLTFPALTWFAAITMSTVSDVTAIWNTNAFWCWVLTVLIFKQRWEPRRLFAVVLATAGVFVVVYGGNSDSPPTEPERSLHNVSARRLKPSAPLMGNIMTLVAAVMYGLYQVLYKKYAALPNNTESATEGSDYQPIAGTDEEAALNGIKGDAVYPPPFGLHPNYLSGGIGVVTMLALWVMIPVLDYLDIEKFRLPNDWWTAFCIGGIVLGGVIFNGGYLILLGLWGPVASSIGNLLTIVLVLVADVVFGDAAETVTMWSLIGSGAIMAAFGVLVYDMYRH